MSFLLPISFMHDGIPHRGILKSLNEHNTCFSLHIDDMWVATIDYKDKWIMDGRFTEMTSYIGKYIEDYF